MEIIYNIKQSAVASNSAIGFIVKTIGFDEVRYFDFSTLTLKIIGISEVSNLKMLKAFIDDLINLESNYKVKIILMN